MSNPRLGLLLFAFGSSLAACNAAVDPIDVTVRVPGQTATRPRGIASRLPNEAVIDDFEDGDLWLLKSADAHGELVSLPA